MNTITPEQLRNAVCAECGDKDPDCKGLVLVGRCHPLAGARVVYLKPDHLIRVSCTECSKHIIDVKLPDLN